MKTLLRFVSFLALTVISLRAVEIPIQSPAEINDKILADVTAADEERQAATKAGDRARLEAIFSNDLRYAHSSGKIDSKASYTESLVSHQTVYESFDYKERNFMPVAPGVVLMSGRVLVHSRNGLEKVNLDLNFLAVWRLENGHWRFLAWQSCRNPPPAACTGG